MRIVHANAVWRHGSRAALAMYLAIVVGVCGLSPVATDTRYDDALVTSVSANVGVLLGNCPKWLPWCIA